MDKAANPEFMEESLRMDDVNITIPGDFLESILLNMINEQDAIKRIRLKNALVYMIGQRYGSYQPLIWAILGYKFIPRYAIGDRVLIRPGKLSSLIDVAASYREGFMEGEYVKCVIEAMDYYSIFPYRVAYSYVGTGGSKIESAYSLVSERDIVIEEIPFE